MESDLVRKARIVARHAVTWLLFVVIVVEQVAVQLAQLLPEQAESISTLAARVVAWVSAAVLVIRRTMILPRDEKGIKLDV